MANNFLTKGLRLNVHSPATGFALVLLALTQMPIAIKSAAEVACIAEVSHEQWKRTKTHKNVNVTAIRICKGA